MTNNPNQQRQSNSGMKDVGKTAAGVALGVFSVPVIAGILLVILIISACVICVVSSGGLSLLFSAGS